MPRRSKSTRSSKRSKSRISLRNSIIQNIKGGSPAEAHVKSLLPSTCDPLQLDPMTPATNTDVSNVSMWKTTGGGKRKKSKKRKSRKPRKPRKSRKSKKSRKLQRKNKKSRK